MSNTVVADIPVDLIVEILRRVPVKSLVRFKCVRKSWYALIKSPSFIDKQLRYASTNEGNYSTIIKHWVDSSCRIEVSFLTDNKESVYDLSLDVLVPVPFFDDFNRDLGKIMIYLYGPCNGILCALGVHPTKNSYRRGDLIALWNPATREMKRLPLSEFPQCKDVMGITVEIGFGFDSRTKDYKVVRILDFEDESLRLNPLVEVYNLSTNCWRKIDAVVPTYMRIYCACSTYLDGFYYWHSGGDNDHDIDSYTSILSFDFVNEVFDTLPLPDLGRTGLLVLTKYKESIALLADDSADDSGYIGEWTSTALWVLERNDNKNTWSKLYKVMAPFVLGILRNENALILHMMDECRCAGRYQLIMHDIQSRQVMSRQSYGDGNKVYNSAYLQLVSYVESLVTFKESNEVDESENSGHVCIIPYCHEDAKEAHPLTAGEKFGAPVMSLGGPFL